MSNASAFEHLANPYKFGIKKYLFELLQDRFAENEIIIERLGSAINTKQDFEMFGKLIVSVYETAYLRSVGDHRESLKKLGYEAIVEPPKNEEPPKDQRIFK